MAIEHRPTANGLVPFGLSSCACGSVYTGTECPVRASELQLAAHINNLWKGLSQLPHGTGVEEVLMFLEDRITGKHEEHSKEQYEMWYGEGSWDAMSDEERKRRGLV